MAIGMTSAESDEMNKYASMENLFKNHTTEVELFAPFLARRVLFKKHYESLLDSAKDKNVTSTGSTIDKNNFKMDVATYYDDTCQLTRNYAIDINDNDLAKNINFTESSIYYLKDIEVYPQIVSINKIITPLLDIVDFKPNNITAITLSTGLEKAAKFRDYLHTNSAIAHSQNLAGKSIHEKFLPLRLDNHAFNMMMTWHKKRANAFYLLYDEVNRINQTGNSITRILGDVLIKGTTTTIAKAVITNVEMERTVIADLQGHFVMEKFLSGLAQYTVTAPGYHPLTVVIKIIRGESLTHNFELEPIV